MDGSLEADGKTPCVVRLQRRRHEGGRRVRPRARRHGRRRDRHARRHRGRPRLRRGAPDRSGRGRRVRRSDTGVDALAVAFGTSHGAYKFAQEPDRRRAQDGPDRGDPPPPARHAPRHARLVERAARARGAGQPVRRRAQARVGRAGEGDPARDPARRPQDQRRHRLAPRRSPARSARCSPSRPRSSTRATTSSPPAPRCRS